MRRLRITLFVLLALAGAACAQSTVTAQAPVELSIPPLANADAGLQEVKDGACTLQLFANRIEKSSPGCYLDQKITEGPGILRYPCKGDGTASADFGEHHYAGAVRNGELVLDYDSELDWEDGCRWGTHASIRGVISRRVTWDYADRVVKGDACSGACTAKAAFEVAQVGAKRAKPPQPVDLDDDD